MSSYRTAHSRKFRFNLQFHKQIFNLVPSAITALQKALHVFATTRTANCFSQQLPARFFDAMLVNSCNKLTLIAQLHRLTRHLGWKLFLPPTPQPGTFYKIYVLYVHISFVYNIHNSHYPVLIINITGLLTLITLGMTKSFDDRTIVIALSLVNRPNDMRGL